jgi:hypothetical protein
MKHSLFALFFMLSFLNPTHGFSWARHDLLTELAFEEVEWLNEFDNLHVTSFDQFLQKTYGKGMSQTDFLAKQTLNTDYTISFSDPTQKGKTFPAPGEWTTAKQILTHYTDEPDWGFDTDLNVSPDQPYMGGTKGPTSKAFRHLYWKAWSIKAPLRTFHYPLREMGEALKRAQLYYNLAEKAYQAKEPYWAFRFLAWSLHYIQDLGQPFHSSQLLTPKFVPFQHILNFKKFVARATQINANYHFMYEYYVAYKLSEKEKGKTNLLKKAIRGTSFRNSSSAYLLTRHASDYSNRFSYQVGEACFAFFGKKFLSPTVDVPNSPEGSFPLDEFDKTKRLSQKEKNAFLKVTAKNLEKTAIYTRSLLELARAEFISPKSLANAQ